MKPETHTSPPAMVTIICARIRAERLVSTMGAEFTPTTKCVKTNKKKATTKQKLYYGVMGI